ncbi:MAG TPA: tetratricopeptide repeat protein [Mycolicibacillus parakoreensis]|nr:tetratricopeptide repeat protein [Mycolicibacillus parakoreensis]
MSRPQRPQPTPGPSLAGAVDLSALKRPPAESGSGESAAGVGVEITEANFEQEVLARSNEVPVVVLLWSPRSAACRQLAEALSALAEADTGRWTLVSVNVDTSPRVAQVFGVEAVPAVVALGAGQPLDSFQGVPPADQLRGWLDALLKATAGKLGGGADAEEPEEVDPALAAARRQLDDGDLPAALASYEAILAADPGHAEAAGAVRQITFLQRATGHGPDALAAADAAPDDIEAALAAADVQILNQDPAGAFDRLVELIRRTGGQQRSTVRTRLIELFELFDPADPRVVAGRRSLANALY